MIEAKFVTYLVILLLAISLGYKAALAQEMGFGARENLILATLDYLEERQLAAREQTMDASMKQAQSLLIPKRMPRKETSSGFLSSSRIHPYWNETVQSDDNINMTQKVTQQDMIYYTVPGVKMNFGHGVKSLNLDMHIDDNRYLRYRQNSAQDIAGSALGKFNLGKYMFTVSNGYSTTRISTPEMDINMQTLQQDWSNDFSVDIGRYFNRVGFDASYSNIYNVYRPLFNTNTHLEQSFSLNQYLRIGAKTRLTLGYIYDWENYSHTYSQDNNYNNFSLGLAGVLSPKVTAQLNSQYKITSFKSTDDWQETTFAEQVGYNYSGRTNFSLELKQFLHNETTALENYIENSIKLSGNHRLAALPKINLFLSAGKDYIKYQKDAIPPKPASTRTYTYEFTASYAFKQWLDLSLDWLCTQVRSNVQTKYTRNIVTLKAQARF